MKELIEGAGKKTYTLVMGRPSPAKLANFPECDVFVYVSCAQMALLDSKEFLAPLITPFEAMLAFNRGCKWTGEYVMDFRDIGASFVRGDKCNIEEARFSFLKGGYVEDTEHQENGDQSIMLAEATEKALSLDSSSKDAILFKGEAKSGGEFLAARCFRGLEINHESTAPQSVIVGRSGRASGYENEKNQ